MFMAEWAVCWAAIGHQLGAGSMQGPPACMRQLNAAGAPSIGACMAVPPYL